MNSFTDTELLLHETLRQPIISRSYNIFSVFNKLLLSVVVVYVTAINIVAVALVIAVLVIFVVVIIVVINPMYTVFSNTSKY